MTRTCPARRSGRALPASLAALVASLGLLAGCTGGQDGGAAAGAGPTATPTPTPTPAPRPLVLPRDCSALVPATRLVQALARPLPGQGGYVAQGPQPDADRRGRVTCTYGATPAGGTPPLTISLADYDTPETAAGRVEATVERAAGRGDAVAPQPVQRLPAFLVTGPNAASLVMARGSSTLVVTLGRKLVPAPALRPALVEVAEAVLAANPAAAPAGASTPPA